VAENGRDAGRKTSAELVVAVGSKTFNNYLGFERGLWRRKTDSFASVPQTRVSGVSCPGIQTQPRIIGMGHYQTCHPLALLQQALIKHEMID